MRSFAFLRKSLLIFLLSLFVFVGQAEAIDGMRGDECIIEENVIIDEDFYFMCQNLEINGIIDGDLIGCHGDHAPAVMARGFHRFSLLALAMTVTELNDIAIAARSGESRIPRKG